MQCGIAKFVKILSSICEHWGVHETWVFCGNDWEFMINWPTLMSQRQTILVIPTSIVVCERGFLKQNWIKSERRTRLNLDTLDALMRVSLNGFRVEFMDCNGIFEYRKTATRTNMRRALSLQEVELDGWFLILHIVLEACTILFMHKFHMGFVFHFYILGLTSWIWTNSSIEGLYESPSNWNSYEGFNLEHCTHPHKELHKGHVLSLSSSSFVYSLEAFGGCDSRLVKYVLVTLNLYKSYMWILDYALKSFDLCSWWLWSFICTLGSFVFCHVNSDRVSLQLEYQPSLTDNTKT